MGPLPPTTLEGFMIMKQIGEKAPCEDVNSVFSQKISCPRSDIELTVMPR